LRRILIAASAVVLATAMSSCTPDLAGLGPGSASSPTRPGSAAASAAAALPSPFMTDLVREAAPDPVAALPAQLPVASRAESWNAGILKRVVALTSAPPPRTGISTN